MAHIDLISEEKADGLLKRVYDAALKRAGKVFQILRVQSQNPQSLQSGLGLYSAVMFGESPLSRAQREMLATVVSNINDCHY